MLKEIKSLKLKDGRNVRILHLVTPEENVPDKIKRYIMASLSYEKYRDYVNDQAYWRLYYREALDGHTADYVVDHLYFAEVEGEMAARVWFAYNKKTGHGNFGNVYTEPEYRRLGLMSLLMEPCVTDFHASDAKLLCCASGNKIAVASYLKVGFQLFYGGETGPLCLGKQDFWEAVAAAFPGHEPITVRPGTPGDQFECDKFLYYTRTMLRSTRNHRVGMAGKITDYRIAFQECLSGSGVINVGETDAGVVAGYAFALQCYGDSFMDFSVHFDYMDEAVPLLRKTAQDFVTMKNVAPLMHISELDTEREALAQAAGFRKLANIPGRYNIYIWGE